VGEVPLIDVGEVHLIDGIEVPLTDVLGVPLIDAQEAHLKTGDRKDHPIASGRIEAPIVASIDRPPAPGNSGKKLTPLRIIGETGAEAETEDKGVDRPISINGDEKYKRNH